MTTTANAACPCIDSSPILLSQSNCIRLEDGSPGVWVSFRGSEKNNQTTKAAGACYPVSYGANECAAYDMTTDNRCTGDNPPGYCKDQFCFVDPEVCKLSDEFFFLSHRFDDLYYSYSTCNSTEEHWLSFDSTNKLDGIKLKVAVPEVWFPNHYKLSSSTGVVADSRGDEYYDDTVPWMGWQLEYFNEIAGISNIGEVTYTYQSKGSDIKSPDSSWTATVHDIQAGISCLAVSNFWITAERLKLTSFTAPFSSEKIYMFIKSPAASSSGSTLAENAYKTLAPFETDLWYLTLGLVIFVAILSVVFSNQQGELSLYWERMRSSEWKKASHLGRARVFSKIVFESFLLTSTSAVTQSVGTDTHNSLAQKFTNVGFAFFILILVSAYTANLAAFLTVSLVEQAGVIKDIEDAIDRGVPICAPSGLKDDFSRVYPAANSLHFNTLEDSLEAYDAGDCTVVLTSSEILFTITTRMKEFCKRDLVMTGPPVLEIPIGFPVCSEFAGGISHWIYVAQKQGITYQSYFERNRPEPVCSFEMPEETGDGDMTRLTVEDFALPFIVFLVCIGLAILSHVYDQIKRRHYNNEQQDRLCVSGHTKTETADICRLMTEGMSRTMFDSQESSKTHLQDLEDIKKQLATLQKMMDMDIKEQLAILVRQQEQKMENAHQSKKKMQQQIQKQMNQHEEKMEKYEDLLLRWSSVSSCVEGKK